MQCRTSMNNRFKLLLFFFFAILGVAPICSAAAGSVPKDDSLKVTRYKLEIIDPLHGGSCSMLNRIQTALTIDGCCLEEARLGFEVIYLIRCTKLVLLNMLTAIQEDGLIIKNVEAY